MSVAFTSDAAARERIVTDLDSNILVEAGAGSGKTTSLVQRMLALVQRGEPVESIAAVTFTRKAANELRERFQLRLEESVAGAAPASDTFHRLDTALRNLDRAFLGTIHSFCARLLREHPIEVTLDPAFQEVTEERWRELVQLFWSSWLDRAKRSNDAALLQLARVGVDPRSLLDGFQCMVQYSDVTFPTTETTPPDVSPCRRELEALLARAVTLLPAVEPQDGWDPLMLLVRRLDFRRRLSDWSNPLELCAELERISASQCKVTQKRWSDSTEGKKMAKALSDDFTALLNGKVADLLRCWREHRYPAVIGFLQSAAMEFQRERHATGQLGFEDLLTLCAKLLREHPEVRASLGRRYARLLVDEFQDTDPIQAEVCFLLSSDPSYGSDWRRVAPRPGSLFLVGDPKQSIYRFRRADIQVYEFAKSRIAEHGCTVALTQNFRSVHPIASFVNDYFRDAFPQSDSDVQAAFAPMQVPVHPIQSSTDTALDARRNTDTPRALFRYAVRPAADNKPTIVATDAAQLASWIDARIRRGERNAGDFLILTTIKGYIGQYARALSERNIPVSTTGALLPQEHELRELLLVLQAIADPENPVLVAAVLEGVFFGCNPADLYEAKLSGIQFTLTHPPKTTDGVASQALAQLHLWWTVSQSCPADVLVERIIQETGLLPYAASQTLGDARAGALLHLVESLRTESAAGVSAITDATQRIQTLLACEADDAPLRPGRTDAVRVMNLHKAKGLEAPVVILAAPVDRTDHEPSVHITRGAGDVATGWMAIWGEKGVIAQPPVWSGMVATERRFVMAEQERLLYVATTRAMQELVVARCERSNRSGPKPDTSTWSPLAGVLDAHAEDMELEITPPPGRRSVDVSVAELHARIADTGTRLKRAATQSFRLRTVRDVAKGEPGVTYNGLSSSMSAANTGYGTDWGVAVHRCIEAMGRGRDGESLHSFVCAVAAQLSIDAGKIPLLEALLERVRASQMWRRIKSGQLCHFELPVLYRDTAGGAADFIEGVADAAALVDGEWLITDWKTDSASAEWALREPAYERQARLYAGILESLSGRAAHASVERVM